MISNECEIVYFCSVALANRKDENGFKHVVLCRVVLGNMEEIRSGSQQFCPSSVEFDSGADNLLCPKKYIVWSTSMNFQILPEYVVSFKAPDSLDGKFFPNYDFVVIIKLPKYIMSEFFFFVFLLMIGNLECKPVSWVL